MFASTHLLSSNWGLSSGNESAQLHLSVLNTGTCAVLRLLGNATDPRKLPISLRVTLTGTVFHVTARNFAGAKTSRVVVLFKSPVRWSVDPDAAALRKR